MLRMDVADLGVSDDRVGYTMGNRDAKTRSVVIETATRLRPYQVDAIYRLAGKPTSDNAATRDALIRHVHDELTLKVPAQVCDTRTIVGILDAHRRDRYDLRGLTLDTVTGMVLSDPGTVKARK